MKSFVVLTFAFLGLAFYELSGGGSFDPNEARETILEARLERQNARQTEIAAWQPLETVAKENEVQTPQLSPEPTEVTRAGLDLVSFTDAAENAQTLSGAAETESVSALPLSPPGEQVPLSELADLGANEPAPLSIAALETDSDLQPGNAFPGSRQIASSAEIEISEPDIRIVKGTLVNMRSGPGTDYDVVDQLEQATEVEVLTDAGNGWVELRPVGGGATGWIAEFLLTGS